MRKVIIISSSIMVCIIAAFAFLIYKSNSETLVKTENVGIALGKRTIEPKEIITYDNNYYHECFAVANTIKIGFEEKKMSSENNEYINTFIRESNNVVKDEDKQYFVDILQAKRNFNEYLRTRDEKYKQIGMQYVSDIMN